MTYPDMLKTHQQCKQLVDVYNRQGRFDIIINNELFVLKDYKCIDWQVTSAVYEPQL